MLNEEYQLGYEIGYLEYIKEAEEKLDADDIEEVAPFDFLINVLGGEKALRQKGWKTRKISRGIAVKPRELKNVIVIIQNSSKDWIYKIKTKKEDNTVVTYNNVPVNKVLNVIYKLIEKK